MVLIPAALVLLVIGYAIGGKVRKSQIHGSTLLIILAALIFFIYSSGEMCFIESLKCHLQKITKKKKTNKKKHHFYSKLNAFTRK